MQLDLFNNVLLEKENKKFKLYIKNIIWYCNHLKNTKSTYNQDEIADYILHCILEITK